MLLDGLGLRRLLAIVVMRLLLLRRQGGVLLLLRLLLWLFLGQIRATVMGTGVDCRVLRVLLAHRLLRLRCFGSRPRLRWLLLLVKFRKV